MSSPLRRVVFRYYDRDFQRFWDILECGHTFGRYQLANGNFYFSTLARKKSTKRRCNFCERKKMTVIELFEKIDNYTDAVGVWAESLSLESEIILGQIPNNSGTYLEFIAPKDWIYLGDIAQIMDARLLWHERITEFDPVFVDEYLAGVS